MTVLSTTADRRAAAGGEPSRPSPVEGAGPGLVLAAAIVAMGLMAGLLYSFSIAVMPGLAQTDDRTVIDVMRKINVAIVNPVFVSTFVGALVLTAAAAVLYGRRRGPGEPFRWILAALVLYAVALAVTVAVSIPLNDRLAAAGDVARIGDLAGVRRRFEGPWVVWNSVRACAAAGALGCLARALCLHGRARDTGAAGR